MWALTRKSKSTFFTSTKKNGSLIKLRLDRNRKTIWRITRMALFEAKLRLKIGGGPAAQLHHMREATGHE